MASFRRQQPFSLLSPDDLNRWLGRAKLLKMRPGQQLLKPNQLQNRIYLVMRGTVRLLVQLDEREVITLDRRGAGQFLGWVSLLRAEPCEWVSASEETQVLALPAEDFLGAAHRHLGLPLLAALRHAVETPGGGGRRRSCRNRLQQWGAGNCRAIRRSRVVSASPSCHRHTK